MNASTKALVAISSCTFFSSSVEVSILRSSSLSSVLDFLSSSESSCTVDSKSSWPYFSASVAASISFAWHQISSFGLYVVCSWRYKHVVAVTAMATAAPRIARALVGALAIDIASLPTCASLSIPTNPANKPVPNAIAAVTLWRCEAHCPSSSLQVIS